jgi:excisionase family DNA binding protein
VQERWIENTEVSINMSAQYLNEIEVAERTHISLATLRRWRLENRGPRFYKFGSLVRYDKEELTQWEQSQPTGGEDTTERFMPKPIRSKELLRRSG